VSGAGAENGAERARKWDERERDLKKYGGAKADREPHGAVSRLNRPLTIRSNLKTPSHWAATSLRPIDLGRGEVLMF